MSDLTPRRLLERRAHASRDGGFTLIEVIVALGVFALVASATVPMLISGLRASLVAKLDTGAKNLAQERFETMRNLPFHVDAQVSNSPDMLDTYYRDLTAAAGNTSPGYVAPGGARQPYEPTAGAFYRQVVDPVPSFPKYAQYISTQFLDPNRVPLTPIATYDSQVVGFDFPPASLVGVTVTTVWQAGDLAKSLTVFSEIADGRPAPPRVTIQTRITALKVSGALSVDQHLDLEAGIVSLDGGAANGSTAAASAQGAFAALNPGDRIDGATRSAAAPPTVAPAGNTQGSLKLFDGAELVASLANTRVSGVGATLVNGLPIVGSAGNPVRGQIQAPGAGNRGFFFNNLHKLGDNYPHYQVLPTSPVVHLEQPDGSGTPLVDANGWLNSTTGAGHSVTSNAAASTRVIQVLPTAYAPSGLVQVTLNSATLACSSNGTSSTVTPAYSVSLEVWQYDPSTGAAGYVSQTLNLGAVDPLASVDLATWPVARDATGNIVYLAEYIQGWGSLTTGAANAATQATADGNGTQTNLEGVFTLTTQELRPGDASSTVGLQLGAMSCVAQDNR